MHERYDRDERRLVAVAAEELWADPLLDLMVDVASPILQGASWDGVPTDAPSGWSDRSTALLALAALGLRTTRTAALTIRAGWAAEAWGDLRRLHEAAGHAQRAALDVSGQYAANWLQGRGKAGKPRAAFGAGSGDEDALWQFMSGHAHADFEHYAHLSATSDDTRRITHHIGPRRDPPRDNLALWLAARQFTRILAAVLKFHDHIDQTDFLAAGGQVHAGEARLIAELRAAMASGSPGSAA